MKDPLFARRLSTAREQAKMTREDLAKAIGRSPRTILNWEHDLGSPDIRDVAGLCDALGMKPEARYAFVFGSEKRTRAA